MLINENKYHELRNQLDAQKVVLVAVSKTKPVEALQALYDLGHRDFGENYVQELVDKQPKLPADIRWHFIGHLQSNKVKYIAPFVHLIHGVDSLKLLKEINKQAQKANKIIEVLLQVHIAQEESKFGFDNSELEELFTVQKDAIEEMKHVRIMGFMGMASFTENEAQVREEFRSLRTLFDRYKEHPVSTINLSILSMGMSGDYTIAVEEGSNMVRIGSLIFGARDYSA
jgi:pyridoxal phosphate enzyme (YggS family)